MDKSRTSRKETARSPEGLAVVRGGSAGAFLAAPSPLGIRGLDNCEPDFRTRCLRAPLDLSGAAPDPIYPLNAPPQTGGENDVDARLPTVVLERPEKVAGGLTSEALRQTRNFRWEFLRSAQELGHFDGGTCRCLLDMRPDGGAGELKAGKARDGGVVTKWGGYKRCKSKVQCPWCAPAEAAKDATKINTMVAHHYGGDDGPQWHAKRVGPGAYLLTLTCPHGPGDALGWLTAWLGRAWKLLYDDVLLKNEHGPFEVVRAWDCTFGAMGPHPHFHVVVLAPEWIEGTRYLEDLDEVEKAKQGGDRPEKIRSDVISERVRQLDEKGNLRSRTSVEKWCEHVLDGWGWALEEAAHEPLTKAVERRRVALKADGRVKEAKALHKAWKLRQTSERVQGDKRDWLWDEDRPDELRTQNGKLAWRGAIEFSPEYYGIERRLLDGFEGHALEPDLRALDLRSAPSLRGVSEYLNKLGFEFAGVATKQAGEGGRSPFEVLYDLVTAGRRGDYARWRSYVEVFKGRPRLWWSSGVKERVEELEPVALSQDFGGNAFDQIEWSTVAQCPRWAMRWLVRRRVWVWKQGRSQEAALWVLQQADINLELVVAWLEWLWSSEPDYELEWYDGDLEERSLNRNWLLDRFLEGIEDGRWPERLKAV